MYDLIPMRETEMLRSWRIDHRLVYRRYLRQIGSASRIVAISQATAADLHELLGIESERIDVVYPLVSQPSIVRRLDPPEPTFLFVGALDPHKQPELALQAFGLFHSRFGSGRLQFVGPGDQERIGRLQGLAAQLRILGSVSFDGRISDDELDDAYAAATALVTASRIEGFGLPPIEAVLRGVPVIAVENRAVRETLEGAATIVASDAEALAEAMTNPVLPSAVVVDAIRDRFSIVSVTGSLAACYRQILT